MKSLSGPGIGMGKALRRGDDRGQLLLECSHAGGVLVELHLVGDANLTIQILDLIEDEVEDTLVACAQTISLRRGQGGIVGAEQVEIGVVRIGSVAARRLGVAPRYRLRVRARVTGVAGSRPAATLHSHLERRTRGKFAQHTSRNLIDRTRQADVGEVGHLFGRRTGQETARPARVISALLRIARQVVEPGEDVDVGGDAGVRQRLQADRHLHRIEHARSSW